ncbi:unnamed protein product [Notodromas monacha]|uniref:SSD domain-containing protein n=1 Tax=Notodromas monacha TaxID=399045 RepID=A0A7R9BNF9_9CRUS|nr:unnamed protein product [Notodromas monacha]CAG0917213.1 unnamed protein product [Notodromas monacha]
MMMKPSRSGVVQNNGTEKRVFWLEDTQRHLVQNHMEAVFSSLLPITEDENGEKMFCCSPQQFLNAVSSLSITKSVMARCPTCYKNFKQWAVQMACHPWQSDFMTVTEFDEETCGVITAEFGIYKNFTYGVWDSCRNVMDPQTQAPITQLLCGTYGVDCTYEELFSYLGSMENKNTPFEINFRMIETVDSETKSFEFQATPCNQVAEGEEYSCGCTDCPDTCPASSSYPDNLYITWEVNGINGMFIVAGAMWGGFLIIIITILVVGFQRRKNIPPSSPADIVKPSIFDYIGAHFEHKLAVWFTMLGKAVSGKPYMVLIYSTLLVTVLSCCIQFLEVTTDPVELWSSENSRGRKEKDYYDSNFVPFFRPEQIIVKAKGYEKIVENTTGEPMEWGPAFNQSFFLDVFDLTEYLTNQLTAEITDGENTLNVGLKDVCFQPLFPDKKFCTVQSAFEYFKNNREVIKDEESFFKRLTSCIKDNFIQTSCLGQFGGPVDPKLAFGGFWKEKSLPLSQANVSEADTLIVTFVVNNHYDKNLVKPAMAYEEVWLKYVEEWRDMRKNLSDLGLAPEVEVAFRAERSIEDELGRQTEGDIPTVIISYCIMFLYITVTLGQPRGWSTMFVDSQMMVGLGGVLMVLASVAASVGFFAVVKVPATLIIIEVIPFLVLAVGVDNIFILVQAYQRSERGKGESVEDHVARVLGHVGPSMLLSAAAESICFFLGGLSDMPAVKAFALYAGFALLFDFCLQITAFVALMTIDIKRQEANRIDFLCCTKNCNKLSKEKKNTKGLLYQLFKTAYAPFLMMFPIRAVVLVLFSTWFTISLALAPNVKAGLDEKLSMPEDSYVIDYFNSMYENFYVGPPTYFVVKDGFPMLNEKAQNRLCAYVGCNVDSLASQIFFAQQQPTETHIATTAMSWMDDYFDWLRTETCCKIDEDGNFCKPGSNICFGTKFEVWGTPEYQCCFKIICNITSSSTGSSKCVGVCVEKYRPNAEQFLKFLPDFLKANPAGQCIKGGHAAYGNAVKLVTEENGNLTIGASYFMTYHSMMKNSEEYYEALRLARFIADNITSMLNEDFPSEDGRKYEVFPYSIFYLYYEQYLTMWRDVVQSLAVSVVAVFLASFVFLGFDLHSALIVLVTIVMIMAVGIAVEFCNHIIRAFAVSSKVTRLERATYALVEMGSSAVGIAVEFCNHIIRAFAVSSKVTRLERATYALVEMGSSVSCMSTVRNNSDKTWSITPGPQTSPKASLGKRKVLENLSKSSRAEIWTEVVLVPASSVTNAGFVPESP